MPRMAEQRNRSITAHDGRSIPGFESLPDRVPGPALVVIQEIFGVTEYVKDVCRRLAALGYVAFAPELYDRLEPGLVIDERGDSSLPAAFAAMQRLDVPQAVDDSAAALARVRTWSEVSQGRAGVIGFCLGGGIAYLVAAASDPDVAVCYYGSAIPGALDRAGDVRSPVLFHFGEADDYITDAQRADVIARFGRREHTEIHLHPGANHAFDNHNAALFHHAEAAARAWQQTTDFLRREFPVSGGGLTSPQAAR